MNDLTYIAETKDCPIGATREFVVEGQILALFNVDGNYHVLDGVCPHQGGPLGKGDLDGKVVTCPWHGWSFDVESGKCKISEMIAQPKFEIHIVEDKIYAKLTT